MQNSHPARAALEPAARAWQSERDALHVHHRLCKTGVHQHVSPVVHVGEGMAAGGHPRRRTRRAAHGGCPVRDTRTSDSRPPPARCQRPIRSCGRPPCAAPCWTTTSASLASAGGPICKAPAAQRAGSVRLGQCLPCHRFAMRAGLIHLATRLRVASAHQGMRLQAPRTGSQWHQEAGARRIHCNRSSMRRATSSCSQGDAPGLQHASGAPTGSMVGALGGHGGQGTRSILIHAFWVCQVSRRLPPGWTKCPASAPCATPGRRSGLQCVCDAVLPSLPRVASAAPCGCPQGCCVRRLPADAQFSTPALPPWTTRTLGRRPGAVQVQGRSGMGSGLGHP